MYYGMLGLCGYIALILLMIVLGLAFGLCLRKRKSEKGGCCLCDRWVASRFLLTSTALTFLLFWLYMLILVILFLIGGFMYTEFCRHIVNFNDAKSGKVLDLVDTWVNSTVGMADVEILPFGMYR